MYCREKNAKTAPRLTDLSTNVANALGKKLDVRDYKRLTKDQSSDILAQLGRSPFPSTSAAATMETSRYLSGSTRGFGNTDLNDAHSEANREFDSLLRTMRQPDDAYMSDAADDLGSGVNAEFTPGSSKSRPNRPQTTPFRQTPGLTSAGFYYYAAVVILT